MKRELPHFMIGSSYGGNQNWFRTLMMRMGGCGAETACDSSVYFALHCGIKAACPFDTDRLTRDAYIDFAHLMEKYLWPRMTGIDKLEIFVDGYSNYLRNQGVTEITMSTLDGSEPFEKAAETVRTQIDAGVPIPTLILRHRNPAMDDYEWHWFLLNGYEIPELDSEPGTNARMRVKAVTYSKYEWLDLQALWNTGYSRRGGFICYHYAIQNPSPMP